MFIPMFVLSLASIFIGFVFSDLLLGFGQNYWSDAIIVLPIHFSPLDTEFIHPLIKNLPVIFSLLFMLITYYFLYSVKLWTITNWHHGNIYKLIYPYWSKLSAFFYHAGFINTIYNHQFLKFINISYTHITKYLDKGFFEFFGPYGLYKGFYFLHYFLQLSWYSFISVTVFFMFLGICLFLTVLLSIITNIYIIFVQFLGLFWIILIILILILPQTNTKI